LRTAPDITAARQVNPHEDHGDGMEEADQELENLLHYLNLPGAVRAPDPGPFTAGTAPGFAGRPRSSRNPSRRARRTAGERAPPQPRSASVPLLPLVAPCSASASAWSHSGGRGKGAGCAEHD